MDPKETAKYWLYRYCYNAGLFLVKLVLIQGLVEQWAPAVAPYIKGLIYIFAGKDVAL